MKAQIYILGLTWRDVFQAIGLLVTGGIAIMLIDRLIEILSS